MNLSPACGTINWSTLCKLIETPQLFLVTFEDSIVAYTVIIFIRNFVGRPTAGLLLRPQTCFSDYGVKRRIKHCLYRYTRNLRHLNLITISPFSLYPQFKQIARLGTYDPQYWDLHDGQTLPKVARTPLADELRHLACGRPILCFLGMVTRNKGFTFFSEILRTNTTLTKQLLVVAAGKVVPGLREVANAFVASGGMLVDRELSDDELLSLYDISDLVWTCYSPSYDQASGIFGRAFQLGVTCLIRRGSTLEIVAEHLGARTIALEFGDTGQAAETISRFTDNILPRPVGIEAAEHCKQVASLRLHFFQTVEIALHTSCLNPD
jgi:hypothetical protein